jgi:ADP-heptose:LPS heptosyltransferase
MQANDDILELLREKGAEAARKNKCGLILQPGAIGDCLLTLPLAGFMKDRLELGTVDILGRTEYIGILPGRTCADGIRSMDSLDLHRLFVEAKTFDLADGDPLINFFADYAWIVTFLGEPNSNFEQNLIFTANCSRSTEVITLSMKPPTKLGVHITDSYIQQFIKESGLYLEPPRTHAADLLIRPTEADLNRGRELLRDIGVDVLAKVVVIQPGSGGPDKCWHLDNFLAVAKELIRQDMEVIFLLGPAELERFSDVMIRNITDVAECFANLSLTQVLGLLSCADRFAGNDSGITHLAAGLGLRTSAVFGPTDPQVYRPIGPAVTAFACPSTDFARKPSVNLQRKLVEALMA